MESNGIILIWGLWVFVPHRGTKKQPHQLQFGICRLFKREQHPQFQQQLTAQHKLQWPRPGCAQTHPAQLTVSMTSSCWPQGALVGHSTQNVLSGPAWLWVLSHEPNVNLLPQLGSLAKFISHVLTHIWKNRKINSPRSTNSDQHFDIWQFITDKYGFSNLHWLQNKYLLLDFEITLIPTINVLESSIYFSGKSRN